MFNVEDNTYVINGELAVGVEFFGLFRLRVNIVVCSIHVNCGKVPLSL
jgi:hypothetical protein